MTIEAGPDHPGEAGEGLSQSITASKYGRWCGRGLDWEHTIILTPAIQEHDRDQATYSNESHQYLGNQY